MTDSAISYGAVYFFNLIEPEKLVIDRTLKQPIPRSQWVHKELYKLLNQKSAKRQQELVENGPISPKRKHRFKVNQDRLSLHQTISIVDESSIRFVTYNIAKFEEEMDGTNVLSTIIVVLN